MSKLYKFEIIKPEIENEDDCISIKDVTTVGDLVELYIHNRRIEGKPVVATITIETEQ